MLRALMPYVVTVNHTTAYNGFSYILAGFTSLVQLIIITKHIIEYI